MIYSELLSEIPVKISDGSKADDTYQRTKSFTLTELGSYITYTATYTIYRVGGYDKFNFEPSVTGGSGFTIYPTNKRYKQYENSSGNAYFGYYNCEIGGNTILYDSGVIVGDDGARGFIKLSTGFSAFVWYMLNALI